MVRIGSVGEILTRLWAVKRACVRKEIDVLRDELPITARLSLLCQTYTYRPFQRRAVPPEPTCHWLLTPGSWGVADASFQPCGQIAQMSAPSALDRRIVAIPVLTFSYARVSETQACPIVLLRQFKGDRRGTSLKGFPTIAEAVR